MKTYLIAAAMFSMAGAAVAETVKIEGYVEPGVEAGCLIMQQGEVTYNITHIDPKPEAGKYGTVAGEVSNRSFDTCMQGTIIHPGTFTADETKSCPAADQ